MIAFAFLITTFFLFFAELTPSSTFFSPLSVTQRHTHPLSMHDCFLHPTLSPFFFYTLNTMHLLNTFISRTSGPFLSCCCCCTRLLCLRTRLRTAAFEWWPIAVGPAEFLWWWGRKRRKRTHHYYSAWTLWRKLNSSLDYWLLLYLLLLNTINYY